MFKKNDIAIFGMNCINIGTAKKFRIKYANIAWKIRSEKRLLRINEINRLLAGALKALQILEWTQDLFLFCTYEEKNSVSYLLKFFFVFQNFQLTSINKSKCAFYRGRFSTVWKCEHKKLKQAVAAKVINKNMLSKSDLESEAAVLNSLQHPNIIKTIQAYNSSGNPILVLELLVTSS